MGNSSQSSTSRPLTAEERAETYNKAMEYLGPYIPQASDYNAIKRQTQFYMPDQLRGSDVNRGRTRNGGFASIPSVMINEDRSPVQIPQSQTQAWTNNAVSNYLDNYFAQKAQQEAERAAMSGQNQGG